MVRRQALSFFAMALAAALAINANVAAQGDKDKGRTGTNQQASSAGTETIRGLVAGVTAEGEIYYNHQSNSAVKTEGAFLTVVASPTSMDDDKGDSRERHHASEKPATNAQAGAQSSNRAGEHETRHHHADHKRHNVYVVWLTPKTKVCAASVAGAKSADGSTKSEAEKKEMAFEQLEVGDQVEIQFAAFEDSEAHKHVHQSRHMQSKHGRHRTHVGYAKEITIISAPDHASNHSDSDKKSSEIPSK